MRQCLIYCRLCNLVKHNTFHLFRIHFGHLHQMPRNSFALAVIIGCEPDGVGLRRLLLDVVNKRFLVVQQLVLGFEVVRNINAHAFCRQVPHMTFTGNHGIIFTDEFLDGFRLRRRLDDD